MGLTTGSRRVVTGGSWAADEHDPGERIKADPSTPKPRRRGASRRGDEASRRSPFGHGRSPPGAPPGSSGWTAEAQHGKACSPEAGARSLRWPASLGNTRRSSLNTYLALFTLSASSSGEYLDCG